jgi:DNA-binding NtrC family response regulator
MPEMSGVELATEIKKIRPNIKTLFMSGYAKTAELNHEPREKAVPFLDKTFTPDRLTSTVREALGN